MLSKTKRWRRQKGVFNSEDAADNTEKTKSFSSILWGSIGHNRITFLDQRRVMKGDFVKLFRNIIRKGSLKGQGKE
jgi:hypothetical protein